MQRAAGQRAIPDGWNRVRLGDVIKLEYGVSLPDRNRSPGHVPVIGSAGVVGYHSKATNAGPGVVIGRKGSIGSVTWIGEDFVPIDTTYFAVPVEGKVDLRWAFHFLNREDLSKLNRATGIPGLNRDDVYALNRPIPPLPEQQAIAAVLDSIDDAIEGAEAAIAATEQLRDSLLHDLLTRGLPGQHTEWRDVPGLGSIPADWEVVRLGDVGTWFSGGTPSKARTDFWSGPVPWISPKDMKTRVLAAATDYISEEAAEVGSRVAPEESIFIVVRGMILAHSVPVAIIGIPCAFNQDIRALISYKGFDAQYVLAALESRKAKLLDLVTPSTHGTMRIVSEDLHDIRIPSPPATEQQAIATVLKGVDATVDVAREERDRLRLLKESTADALLTGRVRVD